MARAHNGGQLSRSIITKGIASGRQRDREREKHRQTERDTERDREREKHRQTERDRERDRERQRQRDRRRNEQTTEGKMYNFGPTISVNIFLAVCVSVIMSFSVDHSVHLHLPFCQSVCHPVNLYLSFCQSTSTILSIYIYHSVSLCVTLSCESSWASEVPRLRRFDCGSRVALRFGRLLRRHAVRRYDIFLGVCEERANSLLEVVEAAAPHVLCG
eukprot:Selendium_serpulae@DN354_c0_g1_i2.p1